MSVLSTLALLVTAAARPKRDRVAELADEIIRLNVELGDARRELELERNCTTGLQRQLERALLGHGDHPLQQIPAGPDFRPPGLARAQELQWAQAQSQQQWAGMQQNAQMAQQHQLAGMQHGQYLGQGLLGAQALNSEMWCNCVPSRSQVWAADGGEA
jgi:hypothetical protein